MELEQSVEIGRPQSRGGKTLPDPFVYPRADISLSCPYKHFVDVTDGLDNISVSVHQMLRAHLGVSLPEECHHCRSLIYGTDY